ncbi:MULTISPECIES: hypothetical protein [unclassified Novosphingobium]|uniref:DUF3617 domain-containing protein n=1 Tax=unclassified Novosphingobium TaxID=2644732 RepID=UPI0025FE4B81|nr:MULTISPECIES: hypothetical protein [unclassified Novosphingobium]HQV05092.1 hypothetical protein [Novosphingobium sp.]
MRLAGLATVALLAVAGPAMGAGSSLAMLDQIEAGRWEIRPREPGAAPQRICISTGHRLIQLRHLDAQCERFVVQDSASDVVVQYTCKGRGYGRTHVRRETGRLVQIDSRGIANGLPFEFSAEARRVGDCTGG